MDLSPFDRLPPSPVGAALFGFFSGSSALAAVKVRRSLSALLPVKTGKGTLSGRKMMLFSEGASLSLSLPLFGLVSNRLLCHCCALACALCYMVAYMGEEVGPPFNRNRERECVCVRNRIWSCQIRSFARNKWAAAAAGGEKYDDN